MGLIGQDWCSFGNQDWQYLRLYSCITGYRVLVCICKVFESCWLLVVGHLNNFGLFYTSEGITNSTKVVLLLLKE